MTDFPRSGTLAIAFAGFCTFLDLYATQPLLPLFETLFGATKAEAGLTVSASTLAVALVAPLVGALADRAARHHVIVLAIVVLSVPTLLAATASGLPVLVGWRFLQGLAIPGVYVTAIAYVTEEAGSRQVGSVMAAFVTGNVLGGFAGRVITGVVAARAGWREAFIVLGVLNLCGAAATWRWLPPSRHAVRRAAAEPRPGYRTVLRNRRLIATYAIGFSVLFTLVASFTYVTFHLSAPPFGLGPDALSAVFVVYLVGAVVTPIAGGAIDRVGSLTVLLVALVAGALGMLLTLIASLGAVVAGLAICCSSVFVCQAASTTYLRDAAPGAVRSLASGVYVTSYYLGGSVGGLLPGLVWNRAGWTGCVMVVIASQLLAGATALIFWQRPAG